MRAVPTALLLLAALAAAPAAARTTEPAAFAVVVHPEVRIDSVSRTELSRIFMKRIRAWSDGTRVEPVDQPADSEVRRDFSRRVHQRGVIYIEVHWKRMIFSGRSLPPRVLASDRQVLEYVRETPGSVGYVSADTDPEAEGVKELTLTE